MLISVLPGSVLCVQGEQQDFAALQSSLAERTRPGELTARRPDRGLQVINKKLMEGREHMVSKQSRMSDMRLCVPR